MTATNMRALQTVTVGAGGTSAIQFNSIPQGYTDLKIVLSLRSTSGAAVSSYINQINNGSYTASMRVLSADGGTVYTSSTVAFFTEGSSYTANAFTSVEVYIPNYTSSNAKTLLVNWTAENDAVGSTLGMTAYQTNVTSAIQAISFSCDNSFAQYSTATLYGITSASVAAKATGGAIYQDTSYFYHVFPSSGTFTPTQSISADILVVAGGGGGGCDNGGGGGAGGLRGTTLSLSATNYTVTVGGGGAGSSSASAIATSGSTSTFNTFSASGGGGGSSLSANPNTGASGGSGGGASGNSFRTGTGGAGNSGGYTPVEGFAGGSASQIFGGCGGGGSAAVGATQPANSQGGNGGIGSSAYSSWSTATGTGQFVSGTYYLAGGGGGGGNGSTAGSGGLGGGAAGSNFGLTPTVAALANTGGGGGGGGGSNAAGAGSAGGSGVVIVRYAK